MKEKIFPISSISVDDFKEWVSSGNLSSNPYSSSTIGRYTRVARDLLIFAKENMIVDLDEINAAWLRSYINQKRDDGNMRFSPTTRIVIQSGLNLFWFWAMDNNFAIDNPLERLAKERSEDRAKFRRGGRAASRIPKVLDWNLQDLLLDLVLANPRTASRTRDYALIQFLMITGLRREEVCDLPLANFDLENGRIRVLGKGNKERIAHYDPIAIEFGMKEWLLLRSKQVATTGCNRLFVTRTGQPLTANLIYQQVSHYLRELREEIGDKDGLIVPAAGPHLLRHTAISRQLALGVPITEVMANVGHSHLATLEIYAHALPPRKSKQGISTGNGTHTFG